MVLRLIKNKNYRKIQTMLNITAQNYNIFPSNPCKAVIRVKNKHTVWILKQKIAKPSTVFILH